MVTQINVKTVPEELTTNGCMKIKEINQDIILHFYMDPDFRGKLKSISWNTQDNDKTGTITSEDTEQWSLFSQVGERPEIDVPSTWIGTLGLSGTVLLRIKFEFDTFRFNPTWYGYLYLKKPYGDLNPPYKVPKEEESGGDTPTPTTGIINTMVTMDSDDETMLISYEDPIEDDNNG